MVLEMALPLRFHGSWTVSVHCAHLVSERKYMHTHEKLEYLYRREPAPVESPCRV